ncbi:unnamed protein product, partial [Prorocentrum cordatum]
SGARPLRRPRAALGSGPHGHGGSAQARALGGGGRPVRRAGRPAQRPAAPALRPRGVGRLGRGSPVQQAAVRPAGRPEVGCVPPRALPGRARGGALGRARAGGLGRPGRRRRSLRGRRAAWRQTHGGRRRRLPVRRAQRRGCQWCVFVGSGFHLRRHRRRHQRRVVWRLVHLRRAAWLRRGFFLRVDEHLRHLLGRRRWLLRRLPLRRSQRGNGRGRRIHLRRGRRRGRRLHLRRTAGWLGRLRRGLWRRSPGGPGGGVLGVLVWRRLGR